MNEPLLPTEELNSETRMKDVCIRERQLERHLLQSPDYLSRANRELKRNIFMLYLAIALLILFQGIFTWKNTGRLPVGLVILNIATSLVAIFNCLLIIRTKRCLRQVNDAWLRPAEKTALAALRSQRFRLVDRNEENVR